jgi:F-type H+-transporting ATPase subunit alpha
MVGRVVNTLVFQLMEKDQLVGDITRCLRKKKKSVIFRQPVTEPLQTGIKADAMIPVGRGRASYW